MFLWPLLAGNLPAEPSKVTASSSHQDLLGGWDAWAEAAVPELASEGRVPAQFMTGDGTTFQRSCCPPCMLVPGGVLGDCGCCSLLSCGQMSWKLHILSLCLCGILKDQFVLVLRALLR